MGLSKSVRIAMKIVKGYKYFHDNTVNLFFNDKDFPRCIVETLSENKFTIYCFKTFSVLLRDFLNERDAKKAYETYMDVFKLNYIFKDKETFCLLWAVDKKSVENSIKKRESVLNRYFRDDVLSSRLFYVNAHKEYLAFEKTVDKANAAKILYKEIRMPTNNFEDFYGPVDFSGIEGVSQFDYKKWKITLDDTAAKKEDVEKLLDAVESKMRGFSFLCYGGVEVKKTLGSSNLLADYFAPTDSMRIKTKNHADNDFVLSFIHELGHRLWDVLNQSQTSEIKNKYKNLMKSNKAVDLNENDYFETNDGYKLKVLGFLSNGQLKIKVLDNKDSKKKVFEVGALIKMNKPYADNLKSLNGKSITKEDAKFPSLYAKTSPEEFFSECFSYWLMGKLNKSLSDWMKELL